MLCLMRNPNYSDFTVQETMSFIFAFFYSHYLSICRTQPGGCTGKYQGLLSSDSSVGLLCMTLNHMKGWLPQQDLNLDLKFKRSNPYVQNERNDSYRITSLPPASTVSLLMSGRFLHSNRPKVFVLRHFAGNKG